jgi:hypothetical protein
MLLKRITRFINRRRPHRESGVHLVMWESELRAIAAETSAWSIETGGDLFGRWEETPTVLLATNAGPKAQRDTAHFRLDVEYLRQLSETLASKWSLRYFGDWHSHHRLGLSAPSGGDQKRIRGLGNRNQFAQMAEIIVTLEDTRREPIIRVHPWLYELSRESSGPLSMRIKVLKGLSPVRQALLASKLLPEQQLSAWENVLCDRIRIGDDKSPPILESSPQVDATTRDRLLSQLTEALKTVSGNPIEQHSTAFGCIVVAKLQEPHYLAFALGADWPLPVLEVHRLNRDTGSNEPLKLTTALAASDIPGILEIYRAAKAAPNGAGHVDR